MNTQMVIDLGQKALVLITMVCLAPLGIALLVGLVISIIQALTQIQDQTLTFIPKIVAVGAAFALFGPWMLGKMTEFTGYILGNLDKFSR